MGIEKMKIYMDIKGNCESDIYGTRGEEGEWERNNKL